MAMRATKIQPAKAEAINELKKKIGDNSDFLFAAYRGLTVEQITSLRKQLRAKGSEFHIIKNNLARIAFDELGYPKDIVPVLTGPTAIAFIKKDSNEVGKIMLDFAKEAPALELKAGLIEKDFMGAKDVAAYSALPSKGQLISMLMSAMRGTVQNLAYTLNAIKDQKEKAGA